MLFVILQILFLSSFGLIIKHYQASGRNLLAVGSVNYAVAAVATAISIAYKSKFDFSNTTCIIGIMAGIAYFISYFFMITAVKSSGISITWSAVRLSVLLPILFSIFYWNEKPSIYQVVGIGFVCLSLPLLSIRPDADVGRRMFGRASLIIVALFFAAGGTNLTAKAFSEFSPETHQQTYLLFLFGTAAVVCFLASLVKGSPPKASDIPFGIALGLCNLCAAYFLLRALARLPGVIVFPITGSMGIVLTTIGGVGIWHEKLRKLTMAGIAAAVIAVVLINVG